MLYNDQGDYARAEPLYRQALEICKKVLGENHPDYATSLNNLAVLYHSQGDYARAEPLFRQALEIRKKALGENHPDYATSLNNLASLYMAQATTCGPSRFSVRPWRSEKSLSERTTPNMPPPWTVWPVMYQEARRLRAGRAAFPSVPGDEKKALGENHPEYALGLHNPAALYKAQGDYVRAEPYSRQAVGIRKKALGENHPEYANSLSGLAVAG